MKANVIDGTKASAHVPSAWWQDRVFTMIIVLAAMAWASALGLIIVKQPFLLHRFSVPLAASLYRPGHGPSPGYVPSPEGVEQVQRVLSILANALGLVGALALGYACLWRYLVRRLPRGAPSTRVLSTVSLSTLEGSCLIGIGALAVILRLQHIARGLTLDELTTTIRFVEVHSLWTTLSIDEGGANHLGNSVLVHLSQQLLGHSEWVLRLPALLLGLTSLYAVWAFTRRLAGPAPALLAAAGLAFSPAHIYWSVTARGYAGMMLFAFVSTWFYWQILGRPSWRKGLLFSVSSILAILFHVFAALMVVTQLLFLLYLAVRELATRSSGRILPVESFRILYPAFAAIVVMSVACYLPIAPPYVDNLRHLGVGTSAPTTMPSPTQPAFDLLFPLQVLALLSIGPARSVSMGQWTLVVVMCALCLLGWIACRERSSRLADYLVCLAIFPVLILTLARPRYLETRFVFYLLPFYLILVAWGVLKMWQAASKPERVKRAVLQGCCLLVGGAMLGTWLFRVWVDFPRLQHGFREAARAMQATPPEVGLCAIGEWGARRLRYYLTRDLVILRNRDDLDQFVQRYPAIACADTILRDPAEVLVYERDIVAFLSQHGASTRHYEIAVYTFGKAL